LRFAYRLASSAVCRQDRREFERGSIPVPYDQGLAPHRHDGMHRESAQPTLDNEKPHIFTHPDHHTDEAV
jgi:hypothetical protein